MTNSWEKYLNFKDFQKKLLLFWGENRKLIKKMEMDGIQKMHERALRSPYLQTSYLDQFDLHEMYGDLPEITAIVPTYNRCLHSSAESNPLKWCLESLLAQEGPGLAEIVVVDDASTDYTESVVRDIQAESDIPIVYLKNEENMGSSISRNMAVERSKSDLVFFMDDDCVFTRYMVFGANFVLNSVGENAAALHLPVYHRETMPVFGDVEDISVLDLERGEIEGNFNIFPRQFASDLENSFIDSNLKMVRPIKIRNLGGIFLMKKEVFKEVGGFPEFFTWRNGYREETDLALRTLEKGYDLYFTPDPKLHCIHLRYGSNGHNSEEDLDPHLKDLIRQSNVSRHDTGNRVGVEEWAYSFLISTYTTVLTRGGSEEAAQIFKYGFYRRFVVNNDLIFTGIEGRVEDSGKRREIFDRAIMDGDKLVLEQQGVFLK